MEYLGAEEAAERTGRVAGAEGEVGEVDEVGEEEFEKPGPDGRLVEIDDGEMFEAARLVVPGGGDALNGYLDGR